MRSTSPPHLVFTLIDDLGHHEARSITSPPTISTTSSTPHLRELAREGLLLERHYAASTCAPSRVSLLSGRLPHNALPDEEAPEHTSHSAPLIDTLVDLRWQLLPKKLASAGYRCHAVGKRHVGAAGGDVCGLSVQHLPLHAGFHTFYGYVGNGGTWMRGGTYYELQRWNGNDLARREDDRNHHQYSTHAFGAAAVERIQAHPSEEPLFL